MFGKSLFVWGLATAVSALAIATPIYEVSERDGTPTFSDHPTPKAKKKEIPPIQTFSFPKPFSVSPVAEPAISAPITEYAVTIVSPENNAYLTHETQSVPVTIATEPDLEKTHRLILTLDDKNTFDVEKLQTTLPPLERGSHTLQAMVVDEAGQVLENSKSPLSTVYQYRHIRRP